jgi:phosphatidylinositol alpha-1,6-mannosyltransferase
MRRRTRDITFLPVAWGVFENFSRAQKPIRAAQMAEHSAPGRIGGIRPFMTALEAKAAHPSRLVVASESFSLERGGAARVGRLMARVAADVGLDAELLALGDREPSQDFGLPARTAAGGRSDFAFRCWLNAVTRSHFIYNHVGIARAHCVLPVLRRPFAIWMLGTDVWTHRMQGDYGRTLEAADLLLSISDFTRQRAAELLPSAQRAKVCWLATEEDDPPETSSNFDGPPTVLILSRIDASEMRKGHVELIDCWPQVMAAIPDARLLIAGGGNGLDILRAQARTSLAASNIEFTGFLSQTEINALWARAHVFAMPSRQEGFGLVYIEAMRYGVPVIASIHDAGQEINLHGITGYNVDLGRAGDLERHLIALLSDRERSRQFGENGREHWREHFCFGAFRRRMEPILAQFLNA